MMTGGGPTRRHHAVMTSAHHDIPATIGDMIRKGVIESVDGARAVIKCGDIVSPPLPWFSLAGFFSLWVAPTMGQQAMVLCPDGDIGGGVILHGLFSDAFPAPGEGPSIVLKCGDGSTFTYDADAKKLSVSLVAAALEITAPNGASLIADMDHDGNLHVTGDVTFDANVSIGGDLDVKGNSTLGDGADKAAKRADDSPATTVMMK